MCLKRKKWAKILRITRKIHRWLGISLFSLFFIISISGLLLGWKKNLNGVLLPVTKKGKSTDLTTWKPLYQLHQKAILTYADSVSKKIPIISRIDVRKKNGIVKFVFEDPTIGIQIDGKTAEVLQIKKRYSDIIENIHDGSILDAYFNTGNTIKLIYTTSMGIALFGFTLTGFWLWCGPKLMRKKN